MDVIFPIHMVAQNSRQSPLIDTEFECLKYEGESINEVNLSIASTRPFWQLTVSANIANF
jgi:hypothetical protein